MEADTLKPVILLFDQYSNKRSYFGRVLSESEAYHLIHVQNEKEMFRFIKEELCELVVIGMDQKGLDAEKLLSEIRLINPWIGIVFYTHKGSITEAVRLVKMGASDYLNAPFYDEEVRLIVDKHLSLRKLYAENQDLSSMLLLLEACQRINACEGLDSLYLMTLTNLLQVTRMEVGLFLKIDETDVTIAAMSGLGEIDAKRIVSKVMEKGKVEKAKLCEIRFLEEALWVRDRRMYGFTMPIGSDKRVYGVVLMLREKALKEFRRKLFKQADMLLKHVGVAFENAEKRIQSQQLAHLDPVTGLYNTRFLHKHLVECIDRARACGEPLSFLFIDVDYFKKINDTHGHLVGSKIIRELAGVIKKHVRDIDYVVRYGGDEFTVTLVGTDTAEAMVVGERIRKAVEKTVFLHDERLDIRFTVSIGIATFPHHAKTKDEMIHLADAAMYRSKQNNRNCSYIADRSIVVFKKEPGCGAR